MKTTRTPLASLVALCSIVALAFAQQPAPSPAQGQKEPRPSPSQSQPQPQSQSQPTATPPVEIDEEDVVRITTNLVQLDVIVTDKKGRQITDLKPEDFQILEDGKPQKITNFSYVTTETPATTPAAPAPKPDKNAPPAPPAPPRRLRPEQVRRTVALVVDDLSLSFPDLVFARRALRQYVDKYVGADDLVAIMRTSAGAGALQQFTSDRRMLYAAIERVRPYLGGSGGMSVFAPVERSGNGMGSNNSNPAGMSNASGMNPNGGGSDGGGNPKDELGDFREEYFTVGTLGALNYVVNGMRELPGRKSVILFSPGFRLFNPDDPSGRSDRALIAARHLVDLANRAAVAIYTIDARGLVYTGPTAADDLSGMSGAQIGNLISSRSDQLFETQEGNQYLAEQTGGLFFKNSNDLLPAARILEDLKGYYLVGFRPAEQTFDRHFHALSAKLINHPELHVRARKGFYGVPSEQLHPARRTRAQQLIAALLSPLSAGDVHLQLTALFTNTARAGSLVSSFLHVDANDIRFTKQADGFYEAKLDALAVTFADSGSVVDQRGITQTLRMREDVYRRAARDGIVYTIDVPIKKPGAYQLRVALRDNATDRIGSASQFIEVPDLKKNRLALSGIVMNGVGSADGAAKDEGAAAQASSGAREGEVETRDTRSSAAVRRFRHGEQIDYACVIFNARTDKAHAAPQLTAQVQLYRDGQTVFAGKDQPVALTAQNDPRRVIYGGRLSLGSNLEPGEYALQIVVTDAQRDDEHRVASQWIDFEIVK
jgi:VWFA-related protein